VVNDSADPVARTADIDSFSITRLAPGYIVYGRNDLSALTVYGGSAGGVGVAHSPGHAFSNALASS
jgi:hypothetical protein